MINNQNITIKRLYSGKKAIPTMHKWQTRHLIICNLNIKNSSLILVKLSDINA